MKFIKNLFKKYNSKEYSKTQLIEETSEDNDANDVNDVNENNTSVSNKAKYYKYPPIIGQENIVHIKKIEDYTEGGKLAVFHFPEYIEDSFELEIIDDEFNNSRQLIPSSIYSRRIQKVRLLGNSELSEIRIGLQTDLTKHYLCIGSYQKEAKLNIGDKLNLLFDNEKIETFELTEKGYRKEKDSDGVIYESKLEIPIDIIELISQQIIIKWKFEDSKKQKTYMAKTDSKYAFTSEKIQLISMAKMIAIGIKELKPCD